MPKNIPENEFACYWSEEEGVIPYWIKSLDIDELDHNIVVHFNSDKYFQYLSQRIAIDKSCSDTDEAPADTYETNEDLQLNTITFEGNLYDVLDFIISHRAISQDTYKRSLDYLKNCSYKHEEILNSDTASGKLETPRGSLTNMPSEFIKSSLNIISCFFTKSKAKDVSPTSTTINLISNKKSF